MSSELFFHIVTKKKIKKKNYCPSSSSKVRGYTYKMWSIDAEIHGGRQWGWGGGKKSSKASVSL